MTVYGAAQDRDANRRTITSNESFKTSKLVAFDGSAGNGAQGSVALFTVTGDVIVRIVGSCSESLASAGGGTFVVAAGSNIINSVTATTVAAGDAVITGSAPAGAASLGGNFIVVAGTDIAMTISTGDITNGTITWYCLWRPLSTDGNLVAA